MPVEGHWERANTPLRARDRRVLVVVAVVAVLVAIGLGVAYALRPAAQSNAGCVVVDVPSTMGGATLRNCGAAAHEFCRTQGRATARSPRPAPRRASRPMSRSVPSG